MTDRLHFHFHFHILEKEMATHSSVLAWRIPGTGEPGWLLSMGSHRVGHDWRDLAAAAAADLKTLISCIQPWILLLQDLFCDFKYSIITQVFVRGQIYGKILLEQHSLTGLSAIVEMFYICIVYIWLLNTW